MECVEFAAHFRETHPHYADVSLQDMFSFFSLPEPLSKQILRVSSLRDFRSTTTSVPSTAALEDGQSEYSRKLPRGRWDGDRMVLSEPVTVKDTTVTPGNIVTTADRSRQKASLGVDGEYSVMRKVVTPNENGYDNADDQSDPDYFDDGVVFESLPRISPVHQADSYNRREQIPGTITSSVANKPPQRIRNVSSGGLAQNYHASASLHRSSHVDVPKRCPSSEDARGITGTSSRASTVESEPTGTGKVGGERKTTLSDEAKFCHAAVMWLLKRRLIYQHHMYAKLVVPAGDQEDELPAMNRGETPTQRDSFSEYYNRY